jgi:hypothetical protein
VSAVPPWVWLATAATIPIVLGGLAIGACIGGTKLRREQHPCADERDGTSYAPLDHDDTTTITRWDEHHPGSAPRHGRPEAL